MKTRAAQPKNETGQKANQARNKAPTRQDKKKPGMPAYLQTKMKVSRPGDAQEQEADQVAERVSRKQSETVSRQANEVQRSTLKPGQTGENEEQTLSRKISTEEQTLTRQAKAGDQDTAVQRMADEQTLSPERDETVQGKGHLPELTEETEQQIEALRGQGQTLPETVRNDMEQEFNADFSAVRIHTDGTAANLAAGINARAFTVGNDIFFGSGEYAPETPAGRKLLVHELTHVLQQQGAAGKVQRETTNQTGGEHFGIKKNGFIEFPSLAVPSEFLSAYTSRAPFVHHKAYSRVRNDQTEVWRNDIAIQNTRSKLQQIAGRRLGGGTPSRYLFEVPSARDYPRANEGRGRSTEFLNGNSLDECARQAAIPRWDRTGNPHSSTGSSRRSMGSYDVDHMLEQRFGARNPTGDFSLRDDVHVMGNFVLLDGNINRNIKVRQLNQAIDSALNRFRQDNTDTYNGKTFSEWTNAQLRSRLSLKFLSATAGGEIGAKGNNVWWQNEIESAAHIDALQPESGLNSRIYYRTPTDLDAQVPANKRLILFGSRRKTINPNRQADYRNMLAPFRLTKIDNIENDDLIRFSISLPDNSAHLSGKQIDEPLVIKSLEGSERVGVAPMAKFPLLMGLHRLSRGENSSVLEHKQASPISIDNWEVDPEQGLTIQGQILPTLPLLQNTGIDFELKGRDITFSKTFTINEITVPSPLQVSECTLTVSAGTRGLAVEGQVDFAVEQLGDGYLRGRLGSDRSLGVEGAFNFNSDIFDPARVKVGYVNNAFYGEGQIGIPRSKISGVRSATITAIFDNQGFSASGEAELDIPGIEKGSLAVSQSETEGFMISGSFDLSSDIPGIKSGKVSAELRNQAEGEGYSLKASGEAVPDIPGFNSKLSIAYDNGIIDIKGEAQYQKGMLAGEVKVGATNRAVDDKGVPGGEATENIIVYGGGSATLQIAPWLQGTVGIAFDPAGEVTVVGEVGLPSSIELLPRKEISKRLFSVGTSIPIVPGIVARISGGAEVVAGFGPGELDQMNLKVTYKPSEEQNTHIEGGAHLNIPADAGIRLFVRGGIGLGIPGASATGGLEVGGQLGIAGAAEASVDFDWTPTTGLEINAEGYIHAQPKFVFDISGFVEVEALWVTVYENRWNFASFEYGSDMTFGVRFPIHYKEGKPFDISLSDVQFETPEINASDILGGLIDRIA